MGNTFLTSIILGFIAYAFIYFFGKTKKKNLEATNFSQREESQNNTSSLVLVFSGEQHQVAHLKAILEENGIGAIVQNDFQAGVIAGFSASSSSAVDLFIQDTNLEKATEIIRDFTSN